MDRLCVAPERGFAVIKREYSWAPGKPLRYRLINKDYREVRPGLWLPFTQVQERYYDPSKVLPKLAGKVRFRTEYKLLAIEFDSVRDELFDIELTPDTMVYDAPRKFHYVVSKENAKPFDFAIAQAQRQYRTRYWLVALNIAVVLVIAAFLLGRYYGFFASRSIR
jgi:hypothetical protein